MDGPEEKKTMGSMGPKFNAADPQGRDLAWTRMRRAKVRDERSFSFCVVCWLKVILVCRCFVSSKRC